MNSSTSIAATAPPNYAGTIDVTVSTWSGMSLPALGDRFSYTAAATPGVTSLSPTSGSTAGGTSITITGTNFTGATAVSFGGVPAASFSVTNSTTITAVTPPGAAGTADVTVTTYTGVSTSTSADRFTYTLASVPTVTGLSPTSGATGGGTSVRITGTNFTGTTAVSFGTLAAVSFSVVSATQITAVSPPAAAGVVDVTVTTYGGTSATGAADRFTYTAAAAPAITQITPTGGTTAGGTVVTIVGSAFMGASAVNFGSVPADSFTVLSDGAIVATAPAVSAGGTADITITTPTGTSTIVAADQYTESAVAAPTINSLGTSTGTSGGGTSVTITGTGFLNASDVWFGGIEATSYVINSDTSITAVAPAQSAGVVNVSVADYGAQSALGAADLFTYMAAAAPSVTSISPATGSGAGGTSITITGSGFTGAIGVTFGGVPATGFTVTSDTSITAITPANSAGTCDIVVTTPTGPSAPGSPDQFTYTAAAAPAVTLVDSNSGSTGGGASVTIVGTGFTGVTGVSFGTVAAALFTLNPDGSITAVAPPQSAGTIDITVTTPSGTSATSSADRFTYTAAAAPTVTTATPASGSTIGGVLATVLGSGFTGASAVSFGGTVAGSFTVLSDSALTVLVPPQAAGTVDITVTTPSDTSATSAADQYTYSAPATPTVTALATSSGTTAGGTVVIITGSGFTTASSVAFGAYLAASFTVDSDTQITAVAPPQPAGTVDVTVANPTGTSATSSADQFTYSAAAAPTVTAVSLSSGPTIGGNQVCITGSAFTGAPAVSFGSTAATSFTVFADGTIVATAPAGSTGTVDITVTTCSGTSATSSADQYTYYVPAPVVTYVSPASGPMAGGTLVTVSGANFTGATTVQFGT